MTEPTTFEEWAAAYVGFGVPNDLRYGRRAGRPDGAPYHPTICAYQVLASGRSVEFHQCRKKGGKGPFERFCAQHAAIVDGSKAAKEQAKSDALSAAAKAQNDRAKELVAALSQWVEVGYSYVSPYTEGSRAWLTLSLDEAAILQETLKDYASREL